MWYQELESQLVPLACAAAKSACTDVHHAELQLENGSIKIVTKNRPDAEARKSIDTAVRAALAHHVARPGRLLIRAGRGFPLLYTSHLDEISQHPKIIRDLHDITNFKIRADELDGLRQAYLLLRKKAAQYDYTATMALGGLPGLLFLVRSEESHHLPKARDQQNAFYDGLRERYHLFPGLQWTADDEAKQIFVRWLSMLPSGSSVLLFDTGTKGNGVREMASTIRSGFPQCETFGPTAIHLMGIVDGAHKDQTPLSDLLSGLAGKLNFDLEYIHVPRVLTEDCQRLIGYEALRPGIEVQPISANAVIGLIGSNNEIVDVMGAATGAQSLLNLMLEGVAHDKPKLSAAQDVTWFTRAMILSHSAQEERAMLENAFTYGWITEEHFTTELARVQERFRRAAESPERNIWNFPKKGFGREPNN